MRDKIFATPNDVVLTVLRLTLGIVFFAHGAQKMLGWFGGSGFDATMAMFTNYLGIPAPLAFLDIVAEFFGGLGLIVGFLTRTAASGIFVVMLVAIAKVHGPNGFFMNWAGNQKAEGYEYHLLALAIAIALMLRGAGAFSLDEYLYSRSGAVASKLHTRGDQGPDLIRSH